MAAVNVSRNERCQMKPGRKLSKEFRIKIGVILLARDWHLHSFYDPKRF